METYQRPTWDEYFIEVMDAIAKRATCGRGRSGCVIARDNQLLVTGYVGSPVGLPHCDEVGHQMKKVIHVDEDNKVTGLNKSGKYFFSMFRTSQSNSFGISQRKSIANDSIAPGPGAYHKFSEFPPLRP